MEKISEMQEKILETIKKFIAKKGYPPTVREIGAVLDLKSPASVHFHLNKLEKKGYLKKDKTKNRSIELLVDNEYIQKDEDVVNIPLIGLITAGNPIEAIEKPYDFFSVPAYIIPKKSQVFALLVKGESMINKGIYNGDVVILKKENIAHNGEIVAAMTDENTVTLKTFYKEKDRIRLQPENDVMSPIYLKNVKILGKAIGLYRKI